MTSLQRWQIASGGSFSFDYWQGSDKSVYSASSTYDGLSTVYFTSQSGEKLASNVVGLTQVWYDTNTGVILETDTALNDQIFHFTNNPKDTTGFGGSTNPDGSIYLGNILTHELGHAIGLAHSGNLQASMVYMESPEQAVPSCDDQRAVKSLYGTSESAVGDLTAQVALPNGTGVFGAQVSAISLEKGRVENVGAHRQRGKCAFLASPGR